MKLISMIIFGSLVATGAILTKLQSRVHKQAQKITTSIEKTLGLTLQWMVLQLFNMWKFSR